jgi:phytoene desaturase
MNIAIIGAGFGGLSAAAYLAKNGHEVTVFEKNSYAGGRAGVYKEKGFIFDTGPGWYMMPDVFDDFFADFGQKTADFYKLRQLDPSYRVFFNKKSIDIKPAPEIFKIFDEIDKGSGRRLRNYLHQVELEYERARKGLLLLDGMDMRQFASEGFLDMLTNPSLLGSFHGRVKRVSKNVELQQLLEFMTAFLGGSPQTIPGMYGMLNWADYGLGVWYPEGGFSKVASAVAKVAESQGVSIVLNTPVEKITVKNNRTTGIFINGEEVQFDAVVSNADYIYTETNLLQEEGRSYGKGYWKDKLLSPAAVVGLIGVNRRVPLAHQNLFFDTDWEANFRMVLQTHALQKKPLFYATVPSISDNSVAPKGSESIFVLIPVSNKLDISQAIAENMVDKALLRIAAKTDTAFFNDIKVKKVFSPDYFKQTFNAANGNGFGLAHTLGQSGPMRPRMRSKKVRNLFYVGHYTNPGTGVPLVLLSGKVVARLISR